MWFSVKQHRPWSFLVQQGVTGFWGVILVFSTSRVVPSVEKTWNVTGRNPVIPGLSSFLGVPEISLKSALKQLGVIPVNNTSDADDPKGENGGDHTEQGGIWKIESLLWSEFFSYFYFSSVIHFFLIGTEIFIKFWFLHIGNFLTTTEDEVSHEGIIDVVLDNWCLLLLTQLTEVRKLFVWSEHITLVSHSACTRKKSFSQFLLNTFNAKKES